MPILTLMEWSRDSTSFLGIILPAPEHYTYEGLNHYSVMSVPQFHAICRRANWNPIWTDIKSLPHPPNPEPKPTEYWIMCEKMNRK